VAGGGGEVGAKRSEFFRAGHGAHAASVAARGRSRRERQLVQIVQLTINGDTGRASGLAAEHLAEFPDDDLIGRVQAWLARGSPPA
jgi:hypothetical protein